MFIGFYLFGAGLFTVVYGSLIDPEPTLLLTGAAMMGMPVFIRNTLEVERPKLGKSFGHGEKVSKMKINRNTDLRDVARIEDPINEQVQRDLKKLEMTPQPPEADVDLTQSETQAIVAEMETARRNRERGYWGRQPGEVWRSGKGWVRLTGDKIKTVVAGSPPARTPSIYEGALPQGTYMFTKGEKFRMTVMGQKDSYFICQSTGLYEVLNMGSQASVYYVNEDKD